jgi:peptidoglycan/LPS O-acetylase OafA/YrhL
MKRIAELDGLRGVAALIVIVSHFFGEVPHGGRFLTFGWLGVDVFFVLSGFLIGTIILEQHTQPSFFNTFYMRRVARIVPVYLVVCVATLVLASVLGGHAWSDHPFSPVVYAVFGSNIAMSIWDGGGEWLRPAWTLAVEEQFYLLLPLLIVLTPRRFLMPVLITLWASATIFRAAICGSHPLAAFSLLPGRMDLLLGGVIVAYINRRFDASPYLVVLRAVPPVAMVLLVGVVLLSPYRFFVVFSPTFASIGVGCFLLAIVHGAPEGIRFRSPVLQYFGRISYALYLVHQPISGVLHGVLLNGMPDIGTPLQIAVTLLSALISICVAGASWTYLEAPILERAHAYHAALMRKGLVPNQRVA